MAQLRQDFEQFHPLNTEVLVIGPEGPKSFQEYWQEHDLPFTGLPDPHLRVLRQYGQEVNLFKMGRMPAQLVIDREGVIRFAHYGKAMSDIPENDELFPLLEEINRDAVVAYPAAK